VSAQATAAEAGKAGVRTEVAHLDTSDLGSCGDVIDELADRLGGVDVFVNNAGTGSGTLALDMTIEQWRHVMAADLDGAFACSQRAARRMVAAGHGGRLLAVTSVHEHQPRVGSAAYDAAKHGLGGLMKTLALNWGSMPLPPTASRRARSSRPDRSGRSGSAPDRPARGPARPSGRSQEDRRGYRVPRLRAGVLRHGSELAGRRRDAADGTAGRIAHQHRCLADRVTA
jgi:short chain dehydrogenase